MVRCVLLVLGLFPVAFAWPGWQTDPVETEVSFWSAEVDRHVPGTTDDAARALAQWPWRRLRVVLGRLFDRKALDTTLLLKATAMYGDIALLIPREQRPIYPALRSGDSVTVANDGRQVGQTRPDTHLLLAHTILRRVVQRSGSSEEERAFAVSWFAAVGAVLSNARDLAGLKDHLDEAREQLPGRAEIEFLSGCLAESIASPAVQAALTENDREERRPSQLKAADLLRQSVLARGTNLDLARDRYRHALQIDTAQEEARVRLARVLMADGQMTEATALLEPVLVTADPILRYYHMLFLGRAYERTNSVAEARRSFEEASRLFPDAQSPWLALSALAALGGDTDAARRALDEVAASSETADDPWWVYDECTGRNAQPIYDAFLRKVHALSSAAGSSRK